MTVMIGDWIILVNLRIDFIHTAIAIICSKINDHIAKQLNWIEMSEAMIKKTPLQNHLANVLYTNFDIIYLFIL